ncbi:MAG: hypothetical protein ACOCY0_02205 [Roseicyclus sp.]
MSAFGNLLGVRLTLLAGIAPALAPMDPRAIEALESFEAEVGPAGESGLRLVLDAGREGPAGTVTAPFIDDPRFQRGARIAAAVTLDVLPVPIFDGIVTQTQYLAGSGAADGKLVILARDLTHLMDREMRRRALPGMDESAAAAFLVAPYASHGIAPLVIPPPVLDVPVPTDRVPVQTGTDLGHLRMMAARYGAVVGLAPGPVPGTSQLYMGPLPMPGPPQKALSVNMGAVSDTTEVTVTHDGETLLSVSGQVADRQTGATLPVMAPLPLRPPLGALPDAITRAGQTRVGMPLTSGLTAMQAQGRAQGAVDAANARALTVTARVDVASYGALVRPFGTIAIRGLGAPYGGAYAVRKVGHSLKDGRYLQTVTLTRGELYPLVPAVPPETEVV